MPGVSCIPGNYRGSGAAEVVENVSAILSIAFSVKKFIGLIVV